MAQSRTSPTPSRIFVVASGLLAAVVVGLIVPAGPASALAATASEAPVPSIGLPAGAPSLSATTAPTDTLAVGQVLGVDVPGSAVVAGAAGLGVLIVITQVLTVGALMGLRRAQRESLVQQDAMLRSQRVRDTSATMQSPGGWQIIASQLVADALHEPVAVDAEAGILDVVAQPYQKFTVMTHDEVAHDAREIVFTTNPEVMKKIKLIRQGDRVIDVSRASATAHADAGTLWKAALALRSQEYVVPPSSAHWYVVARASARISSRHSLPGSRGPEIRQMTTPEDRRAQ